MPFSACRATAILLSTILDLSSIFGATRRMWLSRTTTTTPPFLTQLLTLSQIQTLILIQIQILIQTQTQHLIQRLLQSLLRASRFTLS